MEIQLDYAPDLHTEEVKLFVLSEDPQVTTYAAPAPAEAGYTLTARRPAESEILPEPLCVFIKEVYAVERDRQGVGRHEIIVPVQQGMSLTIENCLLVRDDILNTDKQATIEAVFLAFPGNGDAHDYARAQLPIDITDDMFVIRPVFSLSKVGAKSERTEQRDALFALYAGRAGGYWHLRLPGVDNLGNYFARGGYKLVLLSAEPCDASAPASDPHVHETESVDDDPGLILDALIGREAESLDCGRGLEVVQQRVATLLQWPEFKVEWEPKKIKIGCIRIWITLPILYIRTTKLALYYYYGKVANLGNLIEQIITTCAIRSVLAGAIVGIALSNIQAAIVAFRTIFVECVKSQAQEAIMCLIPGLLILKEKGDWNHA